MLHTNTVERNTLELLKELNQIEYLNDFFLVGGTSLALQIGHRKSIDLDFFCLQGFDENLLSQKLVTDFNATILSIHTNSISGEIRGVKFDFISHQHPLIEQIKVKDHIRLASLKDIAAMKLNAIENRGSKKDFVDIYFLLQTFSLKKIIQFHQTKYPNREYIIAIKSLIYFDDAEHQPDCEFTKFVPWIDIKNHLENKVLKLT